MSKETEIVAMELKVPEKFYPEWIKMGVVPLQLSEEALNSEIEKIKQRNNMEKLVQPKQQYKATIIESDDEIPKIKEAQQMEAEEASAWYNADEAIDPNKVIDNNEFVDTEALQRHRIIDQIQNTSFIERIREEMRKKKEEDSTARIAQPGEFVVWLRNKVIHIGDMKATKEICEKIIVEDDDVDDNDLIVFLRVPLTKIFR